MKQLFITRFWHPAHNRFALSFVWSVEWQHLKYFPFCLESYKFQALCFFKNAYILSLGGIQLQFGWQRSWRLMFHFHSFWNYFILFEKKYVLIKFSCLSILLNYLSNGYNSVSSIQQSDCSMGILLLHKNAYFPFFLDL